MLLLGRYAVEPPTSVSATSSTLYCTEHVRAVSRMTLKKRERYESTYSTP
jgi:hypothetical protein